MADPSKAPLFSRETAQNLAAGARSLADAAVGADRVDKGLGRAARAGGVLKAAFRDMLSPLGLAAGLALGFSLSLYKAVMNSRLLQASLERAAQVQGLEVPFTRMLGSLREARTRLNELARMSASGPFKFEDLAAGNRRLETLSRGALSGARGMQMVQDAAAAAGVSTEQMAALVGGAWDDAFSGRSIEGAVRELQQLNVVSGGTADALISLERSGVRGQKLFAELEKALRGNRGAAEALHNTLGGLSDQLENVKGEQLGEIGEMFAQGKMDGMRAAINLVQQWGPALKEVLMPFAAVANALGMFTLWVSKAVGAIPGLKSALVGLAQAALAAVAALSLLATVQLAQAIRALLIPLLARLTTGLMGAAAAGGLFSRALGFVAGGLLRFLGPIGLVLGVLSALGVRFEDVAAKAGLLPDSMKDAAASSREANKEMQDALKSMASGGGGSPMQAVEVLNKAEENVRAAQKRRAETAAAREEAARNREASDAQAQNPNDPAAIAAAGGRFGELNNLIRGLLGFDPSAVAEETAIANDQEAAAAEAEAERLRAAARGAVEKTPAQFLNDPDFAAAQADARARLAEVDRQQAALNANTEMPEADRAARQEELNRRRTEAGALMNPDALQQRFNQRMARDEVQARVSRAMAEATGNEDLRRQANAQEDRVRAERRAKELQEMGIERPEAMRMAESETLANRLQSERGRAENMTFASEMARVGGAAGEAGGGSSEEARLLKEIKNIMERDQGPRPPAAMPGALTKTQR